MTNAVRILLLVLLSVPAAALLGCDTKTDSTPNTQLGPPPDIPAGRGAGEGIAPADPKAAKQPKK